MKFEERKKCTLKILFVKSRLQTNDQSTSDSNKQNKPIIQLNPWNNRKRVFNETSFRITLSCVFERELGRERKNQYELTNQSITFLCVQKNCSVMNYLAVGSVFSFYNLNLNEIHCIELLYFIRRLGSKMIPWYFQLSQPVNLAFSECRDFFLRREAISQIVQ